MLPARVLEAGPALTPSFICGTREQSAARSRLSKQSGRDPPFEQRPGSLRRSRRVRRCRPPTPKPRAPATEKPSAAPTRHRPPPVRAWHAVGSRRRGLSPCVWPAAGSRSAAATPLDRARFRTPHMRRAPGNHAVARSRRSLPRTRTNRASRDDPNPAEAPRRERRSSAGWDTGRRTCHACALTRS